MKADRPLSQPLYQHVYQTVLMRIVDREWGPGAMLPSESELGRQLGVSQGTARKALMELENRGIVERKQGRGTFVATTTPESALFHFFRLRRQDGSQVIPVCETETVTRRTITPAEAGILGDGSEQVFEIARVRSIDGNRIVREIAIVSAALFPGLSDRSPLPNTLYALYQQSYGIVISNADEKLRAVLADDDDAALMDVAVGAPLIEVTRHAIDILDRCVEYRVSRYMTADLNYSLQLR